MMTVERFTEGYEHCASALPQLLREWSTIDEDLQREYCEQVEWMVDHWSEFLARADVPTRERMNAASRTIFALGPDLKTVMGIELPPEPCYA